MSLAPASLGSDPIEQFLAWFAAAVAANVPEPEAMALATATADGVPSVRIVLYRGLSGGAPRFFTNYRSRKAQELDANPHAAAVFRWAALDRQVRFEGRIERLADSESEAYFAGRPRRSQLGAWASPQSEPLPHEELARRLAEAEARFAGGPVPRPPHWGGFRVVPARVELWTGRENRLHHRALYVRTGDAWQPTELAP